MYESHFGLSGRPFSSAPQANQYFPGRAIEAARQTLVRCIERAEGIGVVIGPAGTGKSLLLQVLAQRFRGQFRIALVSNSHLPSRKALLQSILFELGLPYRGLDEGELRLSLLDFINADLGKGILLLLDEAHLLPLRLVEEMRMIANVVRQGQPPVRLVMAGAAALEERLASPKLAALAQRLSARCYLESLDRSETIAYIRSQFSTAGGNANDVFHEDAMEAVFRATDGIPRLINQLCDHTLVLAFAGGKTVIDSAGVEEAWADLQQLPTPWSEAPISTSTAGQPHDQVVEFAVLQGSDNEELDSPATLRMNDEADALSETDFQPQLHHKPEVELAVSLDGGPFDESFAEEEVIVNPYAAIDESRLASRRVQSEEGKKLAELLDPFVQESSLPTAVTGEPQTISLSNTLDEGAVFSTFVTTPPRDAAPIHGNRGWSTDDFKPVPPLTWTEPSLTNPGATLEDPSISVLPSASDRDMIIVDDDSEPIRAATKCNQVARRQEYRQLFAQMRKG